MEPLSHPQSAPPPTNPTQPAPTGQFATTGAPAQMITTIRRATGEGGSIVPFAAAALAVVVIAAIALALRLTALSARDRELTRKLSDQQTAYQALKDVETQVFNIKALTDGLKVAYASQIPFDTVLTRIEQTSFSLAKYESIAIDDQGIVTLAGNVATYNDLAKLVKAYRGSEGDGASITDSVRLNSVTQTLANDTTGGSKSRKTEFGIAFTIRPTLFLPNKTVPTSQTPVVTPETP